MNLLPKNFYFVNLMVMAQGFEHLYGYGKCKKGSVSKVLRHLLEVTNYNFSCQIEIFASLRLCVLRVKI